MPDPVTVLVPGTTVDTSGPTVTVQALKKAGSYTFLVTVTDDAGLKSSATLAVTVQPG